MLPPLSLIINSRSETPPSTADKMSSTMAFDGSISVTVASEGMIGDTSMSSDIFQFIFVWPLPDATIDVGEPTNPSWCISQEKELLP